MRVRCPHCHNPIEVVDGDPLSQVDCPSCGSNFSLVATFETVSQELRGPKKIAHFDLIEEVGIGRFGSVWKARDTQLDRAVAIKLPRKGSLDPGESEQFLREARAAAQVRHPHIVPVHEVGREGDSLYIVSDFIDGANLKDWLTGQRPAPREAAELCVTIAEALHAAHEAGVTHRDLKPGNILMDLAGRPHIADFGLARRDAGEITMTVEGRLLGTPAYTGPKPSCNSAPPRCATTKLAIADAHTSGAVAGFLGRSFAGLAALREIACFPPPAHDCGHAADPSPCWRTTSRGEPSRSAETRPMAAAGTQLTAANRRNNPATRSSATPNNNPPEVCGSKRAA